MNKLILALPLFLISCVTPGDMEKFGAGISQGFAKLEEAQVAVLEGTASKDDYYKEIQVQREKFEKVVAEVAQDVNDRTEEWIGGIQGLTLPDILLTAMGVGGLHVYRNRTRRSMVQTVKDGAQV